MIFQRVSVVLNTDINVPREYVNVKNFIVVFVTAIIGSIFNVFGTT